MRKPPCQKPCGKIRKSIYEAIYNFASELEQEPPKGLCLHTRSELTEGRNTLYTSQELQMLSRSMQFPVGISIDL